MPVYLSFLVCALSGGACHITIPLERPFVGISPCQMEGMTIAPQWQDRHPGWTIKRFRCSPAAPRSRWGYPRAVQCSQLKHQLARALNPARAAAYLS